jgi:hypothetical protein
MIPSHAAFMATLNLTFGRGFLSFATACDALNEPVLESQIEFCIFHTISELRRGQDTK